MSWFKEAKDVGKRKYIEQKQAELQREVDRIRKAKEQEAEESGSAGLVIDRHMLRVIPELKSLLDEGFNISTSISELDVGGISREEHFYTRSVVHNPDSGGDYECEYYRALIISMPELHRTVRVLPRRDGGVTLLNVKLGSVVICSSPELTCKEIVDFVRTAVVDFYASGQEIKKRKSRWWNRE